MNSDLMIFLIWDSATAMTPGVLMYVIKLNLMKIVNCAMKLNFLYLDLLHQEETFVS
jgi:hypothetical protein